MSSIPSVRERLDVALACIVHPVRIWLTRDDLDSILVELGVAGMNVRVFRYKRVPVSVTPVGTVSRVVAADGAVENV